METLARRGGRIAQYIRAHGTEAYFDGRDIVAMSCMVCVATGDAEHEWIRLVPEWRETKEWLGY